MLDFHGLLCGRLFALLSEELEVLLAQLEGVGEVFVTHDLIFRKFFRCTLEEDATFEKEVGTVGDTECFLHIVVGDEHADVLLL